MAQSTAYVLSSRARDLYDAHRRVFSLNQIAVPVPERFQGEEYLEAFASNVRELSRWLKEHL